MESQVDDQSSEYSLEKRPLQHWMKGHNEFFVSRKQNMAALRRKIRSLLDDGQEVYLHAAGAAASRAVDLALQSASQSSRSIKSCVNTSTVTATDDLLPTDGEVDSTTASRNVSAIHIKLYHAKQ
mmetsp:Transcript_45179/g.70830  ORF Transcript_45179/g.70830 Transcript_45179/m.70830 type:complete len:125 (-) Transcript_45179:100-474(-)